MTAKEKNRLDMAEERMEIVEKKLDKILFYLESDKTTNQKGLVERLSLLQEKVNDLLKREEIYKGKATVWGIVGGAILYGVMFLAKLLLNKLSIL